MSVQITDAAHTAGSEYLAFATIPGQPVTVTLERIQQNPANNGNLQRREISVRNATPEEVSMVDRVNQVVRAECVRAQAKMGYPTLGR